MLLCHSHNPDRNDLQVPQTPASLAQMSLAQRAEQALLQERVLESQNEAHGVIEPHTVTIVGSGAGGTGLAASGGAFQVRGLGQMAAGATLQLAQLAGGQVGHMHDVCTPYLHLTHGHMFRWFISCSLLERRGVKVGTNVFSAKIRSISIKVLSHCKGEVN